MLGRELRFLRTDRLYRSCGGDSGAHARPFDRRLDPVGRRPGVLRERVGGDKQVTRRRRRGGDQDARQALRVAQDGDAPHGEREGRRSTGRAGRCRRGTGHVFAAGGHAESSDDQNPFHVRLPRSVSVSTGCCPVPRTRRHAEQLLYDHYAPMFIRSCTLRGRPNDAPLKNAPFSRYCLSNTFST